MPTLGLPGGVLQGEGEVAFALFDCGGAFGGGGGEEVADGVEGS